jgi:hypothetical protein
MRLRDSVKDAVIVAQARIHFEFQPNQKWILDHLRYRASRMTDETDRVIATGHYRHSCSGFVAES